MTNETMNRRRLLISIAGGAAAVAGVGAAIANAQSDATPGTGTPEASPAASPMASPAAAAGAAFEVDAVDLAFQPTELTVPANTDVVLTLVNKGVLQHNLVIDELSVETPLLNGGDSAYVTVNAPAGQYVYYCSVPGHREAGMQGTLTVQ